VRLQFGEVDLPLSRLGSHPRQRSACCAEGGRACRHDALSARASVRRNKATVERGITRHLVPLISGAAGGSMMSSGDSRAVSIQRRQPDPAVSGAGGRSKSRGSH
jgi:hypothetical protein